MNKKIRDIIFLCICFSLIFNNINTPKILYSLGGPLGNKLAIFPLIIGFIYTLWCQYKYHNVLEKKKCFFIFCIIYIVIMLFSLIMGIYKFPYWDMVFSGPVQQIEKLPVVLNFLQSKGIYCDVQNLLSGWIVLRSIKSIFCELFWCFGSSYLFYCWYKNDWNRGIKIVCSGFIVSSLIFILYGIVDAAYLAGNITASRILSTLNPYFHPICIANGWWPPLLWDGQLRSVFSEPSHIGNYLAAVLPIFLFYYLKSAKKYLLMFFAVLVFLTVCSNARTAYAMFGGILFLFTAMVLWKFRADWKRLVSVILVCGIGFYSGVLFLDFVANNKTGFEQQNAVTITSVLDNNLGSLTKSNERSNGARYALIKTNLRIFGEHPFLGVGQGLVGAYMLDHYTEEEKNNVEVKLWINNSKKYGVFANNQGISGAMNEFVTRLAQNGICGLLLFLLPFMYIIYNLYKKADIIGKGYSYMMILALISVLVSGCNNDVNLVYGTYILLGLGYAMCFGKKYNDKDSYERT